MNPNQNPPDVSLSGPEPENVVEPDPEGLSLEVRHLKVKASRGAIPLNDISLSAYPGDLVIIAGAEHAGQLTLIQSLAGLRHVNDGQVLLNGNPITERNNPFRSRIGFVPCQEIVPEGLTVFEALIGSARLRLGQSSSQERRRQVEVVLAALDLAEQSHVLVRSLDAGQRKRVNLAAELVAEPGILFLDEPTLRLDAHQGLELMRLLQRLADQGLTIVMTDRSSQYLMFASRVAFLSRGSLAWYGPPAEALEYFSSYPAKLVANSAQTDLSAVFGLLEDPQQGSPEEWAQRYQAAPANKQYALLNSKNKKIALAPDERPLARIRAQAADQQPPVTSGQVSGIKQFFILLGRNFTLLRRDRVSLFLVFALPVVLGSLDLLFSSRQMYDLASGDPNRITLTLILLVSFALLVGGAAWVRNFPSEVGFYRRERQVHLSLLAYSLSKVVIIALLALYQAAVWTGIHEFAAQLPGGGPVALDFFITLAFVAFLGGIIGWIASAISVSERKAFFVLSVLLIPQLIFNDALLPKANLNLVGKTLTSIMPTSFAFEALSTADGHGKDLADDPCWQLPKAQRDSLVDQQKQVCTCMGSNIFKLCNFPGIRQYAVPQLNQPQPPQPDASKIGQFPVQPSLRSGETVQEYANEINTYTLQIESTQTDMGLFFQTMRQYMADFSAWEIARNTAISKAESQLEYQFVNYAPVYHVSLVNNWLVLSGFILLFIVLLMLVLKGKEMA